MCSNIHRYKVDINTRALNCNPWIKWEAARICRSHLCSPDSPKLFLKTTVYFYMPKMSLSCLLILSHFATHPPLLFYFFIPLSLSTWNHRFNKQRLRQRRITPIFCLYKTCLFHIGCYNYIASDSALKNSPLFFSLPSVLIWLLCVSD